MPKYLTLTQFTQQGIQNVEQLPSRLDAFRELVEDNGGEILDYYGTLGQYDIAMVTEFEDAETAASVLLSTAKLGNVRTETLTAFSEQEFREMVSDLP
ncbi:MAG: GYD domain-containing protein [Halapricum sp.]